MYKRQLSDAIKPQKTAIRRDEKTGEFCTAVLKEYPAAFSAALAGAIADQLEAISKKGSFSVSQMASPESEAWVREALLACKDVRAGAQFLPDYQG